VRDLLVRLAGALRDHDRVGKCELRRSRRRPRSGAVPGGAGRPLLPRFRYVFALARMVTRENSSGERILNLRPPLV
jgi:hypothetical protein